jgi:hypothetical protein
MGGGGQKTISGILSILPPSQPSPCPGEGVYNGKL